MYRKQVRRRRAVLTLLIVSSFVLLTLTYRGSTGLQRGVSTIFAPVQSISDRALKPARDLVDWFDKTFDARGENSRLKDELAVARRKAVAGEEALQENAQLRKLVALDGSPALASAPYKPVTGRVIGRSPTAWRSSVTLDVGSGDGVQVDDPVISGDGLVGRISAVEPGSSQVMLLTDHASAISAKVVPPGVQGVVEPEVGNPEELILNFIDSTRRVHAGQDVVTSGWRAQGLESHFPPGLPVGEVTKASVVEQEANQKVDVSPFADLRNLDLVQVLTGDARR
ncbi:MAG: rod shape-determining protein MreC [Chloroflexota bacterium]